MLQLQSKRKPLKKTRRQRNISVISNSVQIQSDKKKLSEIEKASLRISLYSLTVSNLHSTLNTLASIVLVANSALAFAAISRGWIELFSVGTGFYCLSLVLYTFSAASNFWIKDVSKKITLNIEDDAFKAINHIDENLKFYTIPIFIAILSSLACLYIVEKSILK